MKLTPQRFKMLLNWYPPYIGAGIKTLYIADDWREMHVGMKVRWYNRNAVGTHFGGSLYSMVDPHLMLLLMRILGKDYIIWDKAADIDFIKATKKPVKAVFKLTDAEISNIKQQTNSGEKYLPQFVIDIIDSSGELIARVNKTLYIKKKPKKS